MWNFFTLKNNKKNKNTKKNSKREEQGSISSIINDSNEYNKKIFTFDEFPERISQINKTHKLLKEREKIVLNQILEFLREGRQKDSKQYFNELSKIKKDLNILETSKKVMEQATIELSLVHDVSDTLDVLKPLLNEKRKEGKRKENNNNKKENEGKDRRKEGIDTLIKMMNQNSSTKIYEEIDIKSLDQIDKVFEKILTER
jgi:hypothetical protein